MTLDDLEDGPSQRKLASCCCSLDVSWEDHAPPSAFENLASSVETPATGLKKSAQLLQCLWLPPVHRLQLGVSSATDQLPLLTQQSTSF